MVASVITSLLFPADYVGFIKRVMKLLQHGYAGLDKIEVELRQLGETEEPPERPREYQPRNCMTQALRGVFLSFNIETLCVLNSFKIKISLFMCHVFVW